MTERLEFHELANIFPMLSGKEAEALALDISEHGQLEPIAIFDGKILDGRNRYNACLSAGVVPQFQEYVGSDPVAFVISANLKRRHLDESQRAMVAAKLANMKQGSRTDLSPIGEMSQAHAAELLNVGKRSVERARDVQREGVPALATAVESGEVSVSAAAQFAKQVEPAEQTKMIEEHGSPVEAVKAFRDTLPTKAEADKRARELEAQTGQVHAVLGRDGRLHTGATEEQMAIGDRYLKVAAALRAVRDIDNVAEAIASVSPQSAPLFPRLLDDAANVIASLKAEWERVHAQAA